jgi:hypothetical protein
MEAVDILVKTQSPDYLDQSVQAFGGAVVGGGMPGGYARIDGAYVVRCFGGTEGFITFAITEQGWGAVVGEFDGIYQDMDGKTKPILPST